MWQHTVCKSLLNKIRVTNPTITANGVRLINANMRPK